MLLVDLSADVASPVVRLSAVGVVVVLHVDRIVDVVGVSGLLSVLLLLALLGVYVSVRNRLHELHAPFHAGGSLTRLVVIVEVVVEPCHTA